MQRNDAGEAVLGRRHDEKPCLADEPRLAQEAAVGSRRLGRSDEVRMQRAAAQDRRDESLAVRRRRALEPNPPRRLHAQRALTSAQSGICGQASASRASNAR